MVAALIFSVLTLAQHPPEVKDQLVRWKPSAADRVVPSEKLWVRDAEIAGHWSNLRGGMQLVIQPVSGKPGLFRVDCSVGGCTWRGSTQATGRYKDGILALDAPVMEIGPVDRFYAIRVGDGVRMVSPLGLREMKLDSPVSDRVSAGIYSYGAVEVRRKAFGVGLRGSSLTTKALRHKGVSGLVSDLWCRVLQAWNVAKVAVANPTWNSVHTPSSPALLPRRREKGAILRRGGRVVQSRVSGRRVGIPILYVHFPPAGP